MNRRANTELLVAAVTAGIVLTVLATVTGGAARHRSGPLAVAGSPEERVDLQLAPAALEHTRVRVSEQPNSSAAFVPVLPLGAELTIIAVDENGLPVRGAELRILEPDQSEWDFEERLTPFEWNPLGEIQAHGTTWKCDELGRVRLPRPKRKIAVLATALELGALHFVTPGTVSPWMLELHPHHALDIRVRDEQGAAVAGLPLELHDSGWGPLWSCVTDQNGRAVIESLAFELQWPEDVVVLTAAIPVLPPIERWLPRDLSSSGVIDLVVPSGNTTTVRLVDARGRALDMDGMLNLQLLRPRVRCETGEIRIPVHDGIAVIRSIPSGCEELSVWMPYADGRISRLPSGLWPSTFDLIFHDKYELVRFLVRDAEGRPLANRQLDWGQDETWTDETVFSSSNSGDRGMTDAGGELSCFVYFHDDSDEDGPPGVRFFEFADAGACPPLRAVVSVDAIRASHAGEIFPVSMRPVPLAASGRVVDEFGAPVAEAKVDARRHDGAQSSDLRTYADAYTDSRGCFTIFAPQTSAPISVDVTVDRDHVCPDAADKTFAFGTTGIELVARSWASIEGQVLVDPEHRDRDYEIKAECPDVDRGYAEIWNEGGGWHWRVAHLDPGTYRLRVTVDDELVCTIDDVQVPKSTLVLDPRCLPIDLRGRVPATDPGPRLENEMRALHFVDAQGSPIDHGTWRYAVLGKWHEWELWYGGEVQVLGPFERVQAWSPGCFLREGPAPECKTTWVLEPARSIELALEQLPAELRSSQMKFRALTELVTDDGRDLNRLFGDFDVPASFDSSGRAVFRVPTGDAWLVSVFADWGQENGWCPLETFRIKLGNELVWEPVKLTPKLEDWLKKLREADAPIALKRD